MSTVVSGGVLVADEIKHEINQGRLVPGGDINQVRGCSYDMTVGTIFWEDRIISGPDVQVVVPPGGVIALLTTETLDLPADVCATAFAINAMSSQGFLVLNPGHVDPGYKGTLSVKAINVRKVPMPIHSGNPIFTVIFQRLHTSTEPYSQNLKSRKEREQQLNATVVQYSPKTLFEMMAAQSSGGPFPSREEVDRMISEHWLSRISFGIAIFTGVVAFLALLAGAVAAVAAIYAVLPANRPETSELHQPAVSPPGGANQSALPTISPARTSPESRQFSKMPAENSEPKAADSQTQSKEH